MLRIITTTLPPGQQSAAQEVPGKPLAILVAIGVTAATVFVNFRTRGNDHGLSADAVQPGTGAPRSNNVYIVLPNQLTGNSTMALFIDNVAAYPRTILWYYEDSPLQYRPLVPGQIA